MPPIHERRNGGSKKTGSGRGGGTLPGCIDPGLSMAATTSCKWFETLTPRSATADASANQRAVYNRVVHQFKQQNQAHLAKLTLVCL